MGIAKVLLLAGSAVALSACVVTPGPDYDRPDPNDLAVGTLETTAYDNSSPTLSNWWAAFEDDTLNELVTEADRANLSLAAARANLAAARSDLRVRRMDRLPVDSASASATEQRASAAAQAAQGFATGTGAPEPLDNANLYSVTYAPSWDLDLFGATTRRIAISRAQYGSAAAQAADLRRIIRADVVETYLNYRALQREFAIVQQNIELQEQSLSITNALVEVGRTTKLDSLNAEAALESTKAQLPDLEAQLVSLSGRLAVLTGRSPLGDTGFEARQGTGPDTLFVDAALPIGDLSDVLRRRPDIVVSERSLAEATENIGLTVSNLFPSLAITGSVGLSATETDLLSDEAALNFSVGPTLSWSVLNLLRARDNLSSARSRTEAALATYQETVLNALNEVQTGLLNHAALRRRHQALEASAVAAREAARIAQARYEVGSAAFIEVLDAEERLLTAEVDLVRNESAIAAAQVTVFRALGAGVDPIALR